MDQVAGIEPAPFGWKPKILAFILHLEMAVHKGIEPLFSDRQSDVFSTIRMNRIKLVHRDGVEPPEPFDNRFTVCPATTYGISVHINGAKRWN